MGKLSKFPARLSMLRRRKVRLLRLKTLLTPKSSPLPAALTLVSTPWKVSVLSKRRLLRRTIPLAATITLALTKAVTKLLRLKLSTSCSRIPPVLKLMKTTQMTSPTRLTARRGRKLLNSLILPALI